MTMSRACRGPQTERTVDMNPGIATARDRDQFGEAIEGSDIEVAGVEHEDGRLFAVRLQGLRQRLGREPALCIAGQGRHGALAEAQQTNGALDRAMALAAGQDADCRRAGKAVLLDV